MHFFKFGKCHGHLGEIFWMNTEVCLFAVWQTGSVCLHIHGQHRQSRGEAAFCDQTLWLLRAQWVLKQRIKDSCFLVALYMQYIYMSQLKIYMYCHLKFQKINVKKIIAFYTANSFRENFYHVKFTIKLGLCVTKLIFIPENQATTFYTSKVLADSGVCDVCGSECFCSAKV